MNTPNQPNEINDNSGIALQNVSVGGSVIQYQFVAAPSSTEDQLRLHLGYLRSWFKESWARVSLADFTERREQASLLDIYVPLQVDFSLTLSLQGKTLQDWWAKGEGAGDADKVVELVLMEGSKERLRPKHRNWPSLRVDEAGVQKIVDFWWRNRLEPRLDEDYKKEIEAGKPYESSVVMEAHDAASVQPRFVLVGDPGHGKSSFVRHLTLCLAGQLRRELGEAEPDNPDLAQANLAALREWLLGAYTPIYIELRDLVAQLFAPLPADPQQPYAKPTLSAFWQYVDERILAPRNLRAFGPVLLQQLQAGQAIILLDGLDEVSNAGDDRRKEQVKAFVNALTQYPARIIVTSRPYAYRLGDWALEGFGRAELRPISMNRLQELAAALFKTIEPNADDADEEVQRFINAVEAMPDSQKRNPLFFTLLAAIWHQQPKGQRRLPQSEGEVYRQSVDLMLGRWTQRKGVAKSVIDELGLSEAQLRRALQILACQVHETADPRSDTTDFKGNLLAAVLLDVANVKALDVLDYLEQRAGMLVSPRDKVFRFAHRSFQEHLAACELTCMHDPTRQPALDPADVFPHGLTRRVLAQPDLWRNVALHASDQLQGVRVHDLWEWLPGLFEPYLSDATDAAHGQAALLALDMAARHSLLTPQRKKYSAEAGILEGLQQVALKAMSDVTLTAAQRCQAGNCLAQVGDPRFNPTLWHLPKEPLLGFVKIPACDYALGTRAADFEPLMRKLEIEEKDWDSWRIEINDAPTLVGAFYMARHPVTVAQWLIYVDEKRRGDPDFKLGDERSVQGIANHPVVYVSWHEAMGYCNWLTDTLMRSPHTPPALRDKLQQGWRVTLPSELQWERAARETCSDCIWPWGNEPDPEKANYYDTRIQATSTVGCFPAGAIQPFGLHDVIGNVWEWTRSKFKEYPYDAEDGREVMDSSNDRRVVRGGSWDLYRRDARCAYRYRFEANDTRYDFVGFRLVVSPVSS